MFGAGLADEFEALKSAGYTAESPGLKAIGYSEFFSMEGAPRDDIAAAIELHTSQYMKRQMTFLRALPGIRWMKADPALFARTVLSFLSGSLR
jgi:tRNA dimethylallyltransferase